MSTTGKDTPKDLESRNAAMKTRIISHMNADHADSLSYFLQYYCGVPPAATSNSKMTEINLDYMIIESVSGRNIINFEPPMESLAESRERMVTMHQDCLKGLGLSDIKIQEFATPNRLWHWALILLCLWCYITLPFPAKIRPGSHSSFYYGWSAGGRLPGLAQLAADSAYIVLPFMVIVHAGETIWLWRSRLRKHAVSLSTPAAWLWLGVTFWAGAPGIARFDALVKEKQSVKDSKH